MLVMLKKWGVRTENIRYYGLLIGGVGLALYLWRCYYLDIQLLMVSEVRQQELLQAINIHFHDFMTLALSLIVEAMPFVILGVTFRYSSRSFYQRIH